MSNKVILILTDGMRPDGIEQCGDPFIPDLLKESTSCFHASTVFPSVTLPCHSSLFLSVDPERHGILDNIWHSLVRPVDSLCDTVARYNKKAAMFYNWEQLRDLNRPGSLVYSHYQTLHIPEERIPASEREMTEKAVDYINKENPDFVFLYLGWTDEAGHHHGWMSRPYLDSIANASRCIRYVKEHVSDDYSIILTADHGGHDRAHGTRMPEDMTIPIVFYGKPFEKGKTLPDLNIKDIAPTVTDVLEIPHPDDWEGKSILR